MPAGDPGGHYASSGGYPGGTGGMPGGGGSASGNVSGAEHGMLGFGQLSPGGFNSGVYNANLNAARLGGAGAGGIAGAIARGRAIMAARARQKAFASKYPGFAGVQPQPKPNPLPGTGVINPAITTPPAEVVPEEPIYTGPLPGDPVPDWGSPWTGAYGGYPSHKPGSVGPGWSQGNPSTGFSGKDQSRIAPGGINSWGGTVGWGGRGGVAGVVGSGTLPRQFGGPVAPGQSYTVGENGPETLQMGPGGGGYVVPHDKSDRMKGAMDQLKKWHEGRRNANGRAGFDGRPFRVGSGDLALRGFR